MATVIDLYITKRVRTSPKPGRYGRREVSEHHPRANFLGKDHAGFVIVEVKLLQGEGVCWECGMIAEDPDGRRFRCPACNGFFNGG